MSPEQTSSRPATAPAYHGQQLDQMLPPKRDLPFLKPTQKRPRGEETTRTATSPLVSRTAPSDLVTEKSGPQNDDPSMGRSMLEQYDSQILNSQSQPPTSTCTHLEGVQTSFISSGLHPIRPNLSPVPTTTQRPGSESRVESNISAEAPRDEVGNNTQDKQALPPPVSVESQLTLYLSSPTPERVKYLENWMCELIEDDKFMALCEDVETTWRRFALGIRK